MKGMENTNNVIEVNFKREEPSVVAQLETMGFSVKQTGDDAFIVKSMKTGAVLNANASERDLRSYLTCINYTANRHGRDITTGFKYTQPAHA